jgi:hypothetical protein
VATILNYFAILYFLTANKQKLFLELNLSNEITKSTSVDFNEHSRLFQLYGNRYKQILKQYRSKANIWGERNNVLSATQYGFSKG